MLTDLSLMPVGEYKGRAMSNVPAKYLLSLLEDEGCNKDVRSYIECNKDCLELEQKDIVNFHSED